MQEAGCIIMKKLFNNSFLSCEWKTGPLKSTDTARQITGKQHYKSMQLK
jgi:hypothetical protein